MDCGICFAIEVAGIVFRVRCNDPGTRRLCRGFETAWDTPAKWEITLDRAALEAERARYPMPETEAGLERQCLCRHLATRLCGENVVLFHSSALTFDGQAVLFTAPSGTGKSTHTRLWRQRYGERVEMINDDKPLVGFDQETLTVYGFPWQGKHNLGSNRAAPLKAICVVTRGRENRMERISPRDAFPLVLQQIYRPEPAELVANILSLTGQLCSRIPVYRLYCTMEPEAAETACRAIFGAEDSKE